MSRETVKRDIRFYEDKKGRLPFVEWLEALDMRTQARIRHRLTRVEEGNLGDCFPVGEGVMELRFFFGPGFRVYFGETDKTVIILLMGGDKKAKEYWENHQGVLR